MLKSNSTIVFDNQSTLLSVTDSSVPYPVSTLSASLPTRILRCQRLLSASHNLPTLDLPSCLLNHSRNYVEGHVIVGDHDDSLRLQYRWTWHQVCHWRLGWWKRRSLAVSLSVICKCNSPTRSVLTSAGHLDIVFVRAGHGLFDLCKYAIGVFMTSSWASNCSSCRIATWASTPLPTCNRRFNHNFRSTFNCVFE